MAFILKDFDSSLIGGHLHHHYHSVDTVATQLGANYFDNKDLSRRVKKGETIILVGLEATTPETQLCVISAVVESVPTVTVIVTILA